MSTLEDEIAGSKSAGADSADGSVRSAIEAWRELYGGEVADWPLHAGREDLQVVAIRHADFRPDRGNWPKLIHHRRPTSKVVVLIHGLKDCPGFMEAIGNCFAEQGANVVLPLLAAHGREDPVAAMRQVDFVDWRATVDRAVEIAAGLGGEVSIGGLSTGGALAFDKALRDPETVTGKIFLFSAALGLKPFQRLILSSAWLCRAADAWLAWRSGNGIAGNPLKYMRTFMTGGRQVHRLISAMQQRLGDAPQASSRLRQRVFVAHSMADQTIEAAAVEPFIRSDDSGQHHIIPAARNVAHAELVLAATMRYEKTSPKEPDPPRANPEFEPMMEKALAFFGR